MKKMVERDVCEKNGCDLDKQYTCGKCDKVFCEKHCGILLESELRHSFGPSRHTICDTCHKDFGKWLKL